MEDKNGRLIFCEPSDAAGAEPFAISELTYLVRAIAKREDARSRLVRLSIMVCLAAMAPMLCTYATGGTVFLLVFSALLYWPWQFLFD